MGCIPCQGIISNYEVSNYIEKKSIHIYFWKATICTSYLGLCGIQMSKNYHGRIHLVMHHLNLSYNLKTSNLAILLNLFNRVTYNSALATNNKENHKGFPLHACKLHTSHIVASKKIQHFNNKTYLQLIP